MARLKQPSRFEAEARAFGLLVEADRKPGETLDTVFLRVRRRDPRRWGSPAKMWRLWAVHRRLTAGTVALPGNLQQGLDRVLDKLGHFNLPGHRERILAAAQQAATVMHSVQTWLDAEKARPPIK